MQIKEPKKTVTISLPLELYETLSGRAGDTCRTIPGYIRQILKRYMEYLDQRGELGDEWLEIQ